jgi:hypothetical protein
MIGNLKGQIDSLEAKARENEKNLQNINVLYQEFMANKQSLMNKLHDRRPALNIPVDRVAQISANVTDQCLWLDKEPIQCSTQMYDVYNQRVFDDVDGGVWKQGWDIQYDKSKWNTNNILNIVITPHSHNDPGDFLFCFEWPTQTVS